MGLMGVLGTPYGIQVGNFVDIGRAWLGTRDIRKLSGTLSAIMREGDDGGGMDEWQWTSLSGRRAPAFVDSAVLA